MLPFRAQARELLFADCCWLRDRLLGYGWCMRWLTSFRYLHDVRSNRINCYRIPVGHPVAVSPPQVHVEMVESRSQLQGLRIALTGSAAASTCFFFHLKMISSESPTFWFDCVGISIVWQQWWWKEVTIVGDGEKHWFHASLLDFKLQILLHSRSWPVPRFYMKFPVELQNFL